MDPRKIDLNLLVLFEAIYSAGNVGKAASRLGLSQPAASNALSRLRKQLDDPLFTRSADGVAPTARARELIQRVRDALSVLSANFDAGLFDLATYQRQFRVVMIDALEPVLMPPVVRLITEHAPGISLEMVATPFSDIAAEMRAGTIDLGVFSFPHDAPDIVTVPLGPTDMVMLARRDHPGLKGGFDVEKMRTMPHLALTRSLRAQTHMPRDLAAHGIERRIVCGVNKIWSLPWMVEHTDLVAFTARRFVETLSRNHAIELHEIPIPMSEQYTYLMWHERDTGDPGHRWLREALIEASNDWRAREPTPKTVKHPAAKRPRSRRAKR